eukprot:3437641-Rhodomonas_salina.1
MRCSVLSCSADLRPALGAFCFADVFAECSGQASVIKEKGARMRKSDFVAVSGFNQVPLRIQNVGSVSRSS